MRTTVQDSLLVFLEEQNLTAIKLTFGILNQIVMFFPPNGRLDDTHENSVRMMDDTETMGRSLKVVDSLTTRVLSTFQVSSSGIG